MRLTPTLEPVDALDGGVHIGGLDGPHLLPARLKLLPCRFERGAWQANDYL